MEALFYIHWTVYCLDTRAVFTPEVARTALTFTSKMQMFLLIQPQYFQNNIIKITIIYCMKYILYTARKEIIFHRLWLILFEGFTIISGTNQMFILVNQCIITGEILNSFITGWKFACIFIKNVIKIVVHFPLARC